MKQRKKYILLILLLVPFKVHALTGNIITQCDKTNVLPGDKITCTVKGTVSDDKISSISARVKLTSNLTLTKVITDSSWQGDGNDGQIELYTDTNKTGTFPILTLELTVSNSILTGSEETVTINEIAVSGEDYKPVSLADSKVSLKIPSTINTLSTLTLSTGTLSPTFNKDTLNYQAVIKEEKVTINATKTDAKSSLQGVPGEVTLKYGANTFKINVISESGATKTYSLVITRPDERDKDNQLASLLVNNESIDLKSGQTEYTYEVENDVTEVDIDAVLNSSKASFVEDYNPRTVTLQEGANKIELKVKAENEEIVTYTLTINRKKAITTENKNNTSNANSNQQLTNPKTGMTSIYIVIAIVLVSLLLIFAFYKVMMKKGRKDKENHAQKR